MLERVAEDSDRRLVDVLLYLHSIRSRGGAPAPNMERAARAAKGLFFVHLYGAYAFTVRGAVGGAVEAINSSGVEVRFLRRSLLSLVLDAECRGLVDSRGNWAKRCELFERTEACKPASIHDGVVPGGDDNYSLAGLRSIWRAFALAEDRLPERGSWGLIDELVMKRHEIAHGAVSAADVGARFTIGELDRRRTVINKICLFVIDVFRKYLEKKAYLLPPTS